MRKPILFFLVLLSYSFTFAQDAKIDSLINKLTQKIAASQYYFHDMIYPDIAHIRDVYDAPNLLKNDTPFIWKLKDYYYKRFYPYRKLLDADFIITEDCITEDVNAKLIDAYKLLFYSLYDNIRLPQDYIKRLETTAKEDDPFLSPYYALKTIYYLKRYNYKQLNAAQQAQLKALEENLSTLLYTNYVRDKNWSFRKILAVNVLKINKNSLVKNLDLTELVDYFLAQGAPKTNILDIAPYQEDTKDLFLLNNIGFDKVMQLEVISTLWIILDQQKR